MGIRQTLNERPWTAYATAGLAVAIAGLVLWLSNRSVVAELPPQLYFSDDDGKTYFADDSAKVPPFDHNGKEAYLVGVFQCPGGKPFVAYLLRYTPVGKSQLEAFSTSVRRSADPKVAEIKSAHVEVKAPGEQRWVNSTDLDFDVRLTPACPKTNSGMPAQLMPNE